MKLQYNLIRMNHAFILHWIFRIAAAGCFIGHGVFGIITKSEWLPYFALVHINPKTGYQLMPLIGLTDIAFGISILIRPILIEWVSSINSGRWC